MALFRRNYGGYGREDKQVGLKTLLRGDTFLIRILAFALCIGVYYLIVHYTHKDMGPGQKQADSLEAPQKK
jgi:hypothetical protein